MIYTYESKDGERIERVFSMLEYKKKIRHKGKTFTIVVTGGAMCRVEPDFTHHAYHVEDNLPFSPRVDELGFPVLIGRREIENFQAAYRDLHKQKEDYRYDFRGFGTGRSRRV